MDRHENAPRGLAQRDRKRGLRSANPVYSPDRQFVLIHPWRGAFNGPTVTEMRRPSSSGLLFPHSSGFDTLFADRVQSGGAIDGLNAPNAALLCLRETGTGCASSSEPEHWPRMRSWEVQHDAAARFNHACAYFEQHQTQSANLRPCSFSVSQTPAKLLQEHIRCR